MKYQPSAERYDKMQLNTVGIADYFCLVSL